MSPTPPGNPTPPGQPADWVPTPLRGEPIAGDWVTSPLLVGRWCFAASLIPNEWLLRSGDAHPFRTIAISHGDVASFEFHHAYPPENAAVSTTPDVEVTDEMVAAAWQVWWDVGEVRWGAQVRDFIRPGMTADERAAGLEAMHAEDARNQLLNDRLMRRVIAAAIAAS